MPEGRLDATRLARRRLGLFPWLPCETDLVLARERLETALAQTALQKRLAEQRAARVVLIGKIPKTPAMRRSPMKL